MSVGFLDEREGHRSSRRLIMVVLTANASLLLLGGAVAMLAYPLGEAVPRSGPLLAAGGALAAAILPIMQWGKSLERGNGKAP